MELLFNVFVSSENFPLENSLLRNLTFLSLERFCFFFFLDKKVLSFFSKFWAFFRVVFNQRIELKPRPFAEKLVGLVNKTMPWSVTCLLLLTF